MVSMLRGVAADAEFWKPIVKEPWNTAPSTVRLIPDDWLLLFIMPGVNRTAHAPLANAN